MTRLCSCSAGVLAFLAQVLHADTTNLTQGTTHPTIQAAIDAAVAGDEIVVDPGEYLERLDLADKAVTVRSQAPTNPAVVITTVIDGDEAGTVITCDSGEGPDTVISGLVITGGRASDGGGMINFQASPTISHCTFMRNTGDSGGGGAMLNWNGAGEYLRCRFVENSSEWGSSIYCDGSSAPLIDGCLFTYGEGGPVLEIHPDANPTVPDSVFAANSAWHIAGDYVDGGGNRRLRRDL